MSSTMSPQDVTSYLPLNEALFFDAGLVSTVFLYMLAQSSLRSTTRARALTALIVALRPVIHHAVESTMPERLRDVPAGGTLVAVAEEDLRRVLPTMRIRSAEDLLVRVANRVRDVASASVPMAPLTTTAPVQHGRHLLLVLPPHVVFALVAALYPSLDDGMVEVLTRMTHVGATWERVARALGSNVDTTMRRYIEARALAEDRIVHEIARRQPWPVAATIRLASQTHVA